MVPEVQAEIWSARNAVATIFIGSISAVMEEAHKEEVEDLKRKNDYEALLCQRIWKGESGLFSKRGKK